MYEKESSGFVYAESEQMPATLNDSSLSSTSETTPPLDGEYIYIPLMQGRISAGGGLIPDNSIEMHCAFHKEWISRKGDHRKMSLIRVLGDSMAPTLLDGDVVLVNHNVCSITVSDGIYAIVLEDEILIKRIEKLIPSGQLKVKGDNPDYESFIVDPPQIIINGKVIWYARTLER